MEGLIPADHCPSSLAISMPSCCPPRGHRYCLLKTWHCYFFLAMWQGWERESEVWSFLLPVADPSFLPSSGCTQHAHPVPGSDLQGSRDPLCGTSPRLGENRHGHPGGGCWLSRSRWGTHRWDPSLRDKLAVAWEVPWVAGMSLRGGIRVRMSCLSGCEFAASVLGPCRPCGCSLGNSISTWLW